MTTLNISLPENLRKWISIRIKKGDYTTASDYLRDLIRNDQKQVGLDQMLLEGINSGEAIEVTPALLGQKQQQLKVYLKNKK